MGAQYSVAAQRKTKVAGPPLRTTNLLSQQELSELTTVCGELGPDPTSNAFAPRTKNIAFVFKKQGRWYQINQNFFNQSTEYNVYSGGYKRFYRELPADFIHSPVSVKILDSFQKTYNIPDEEFILVQVQTTHISSDDIEKSVTGQGIHTDGADCALIICMKRKNVQWARNRFFKDPEGLEPLTPPFVLKEGEAAYWKDNKIFHYVEPAKVVDEDVKGERTVLIAHYPALHYITGGRNPNNKLLQAEG